jgi:signal transduction histidine kinase
LPENKKFDLDKVRQLNKQAIADTRRISHGLMITGIEDFGLVHLIKEICYHSNMPELVFSFRHQNIKEEKINIETKVHFYRIVQELSTNILKHSKATKAKISLRMENDNHLALLVSDNGRGYNPDSVKLGAGLKNINQRITILNGSIDIKSSSAKGTTIKIHAPV